MSLSGGAGILAGVMVALCQKTHCVSSDTQGRYRQGAGLDMTEPLCPLGRPWRRGRPLEGRLRGERHGDREQLFPFPRTRAWAGPPAPPGRGCLEWQLWDSICRPITVPAGPGHPEKRRPLLRAHTRSNEGGLLGDDQPVIEATLPAVPMVTATRSAPTAPAASGRGPVRGRRRPGR